MTRTVTLAQGSRNWAPADLGDYRYSDYDKSVLASESLQNKARAESVSVADN